MVSLEFLICVVSGKPAVMFRIWEVEEEEELVDEITDYSGWCVKSIDYQEVIVTEFSIERMVANYVGLISEK